MLKEECCGLKGGGYSVQRYEFADLSEPVYDHQDAGMGDRRWKISHEIYNEVG